MNNFFIQIVNTKQLKIFIKTLFCNFLILLCIINFLRNLSDFYQTKNTILYSSTEFEFSSDLNKFNNTLFNF